MKKLNARIIENYLNSRYGHCRHNSASMYKAIIATSRKYKQTRLDIFKYIIGEKNIDYATSYGFDTAYGREIKDYFSYKYIVFNSDSSY